MRPVLGSGRERVRHVVHLTRRFLGSLSRRPPPEADETWARSFLLPGELELWERMGNIDRRHSIEVARRFERFTESPTRDEIAAALMHDVGKIDSGLGTISRVVTIVAGPVTPKMRRYHDHELIGVAMLRRAGSSETTIAMCLGEHPHSPQLWAADNI